MAEEQAAEAQSVEATVVDQATQETVSETAYLDGKYKSVGALEDAYRELQSSYSKKLGKFTGAPEDGAYALPEGIEESDLIGVVKSWGVENQLSNDGLASLVSAYEAHRMETHNKTVDAEMKKLGENADRRLANVRDFLTANVGEDAVRELGSTLNSAASITAIEKIIAMTKGVKPAEVPASPGVSAEQLAKMRFATNDKGDRLMSVDPAYRAKVMALEAAAKGSPATYVVRD